MGAPWIQDYNRTVPSGTPPSGGLRYQLANPQEAAYIFVYNSPNSTGNVTITIHNADGHPSRPQTVVPGGLLNQGPTGIAYVDISGSGQIVTVIIADSETAINASLVSTSVTISNNVNLAAQGAPGSAPPSNAVFVGGTDGTDLRALSTDASGVVQGALPAVQGPTGAAVPSKALQVAGSDGTDLRALSTDTTGALKLSIVKATISPTTSAGTITTGGTAQALASASTPVRKFMLTNTGSTDTLYVGGSTVSSATPSGIAVAVGNTLILEVNGDYDQFDLSQWYVVGATTGDKFSLTYT